MADPVTATLIISALASTAYGIAQQRKAAREARIAAGAQEDIRRNTLRVQHQAAQQRLALAGGTPTAQKRKPGFLGSDTSPTSEIKAEPIKETGVSVLGADTASKATTGTAGTF